MRIPSKLKLAGINIDVEHKELASKNGCIGEAAYTTQKIYIDTKVAPQETTEQAFYHELVHWILYIMNEDSLRNNEKFVDLMAHLLYQAIDTSEYEQPTD